MTVKTLQDVSRLLHIPMELLREWEREGRLEHATLVHGYDVKKIRTMVPRTKSISRQVV